MELAQRLTALSAVIALHMLALSVAVAVGSGTGRASEEKILKLFALPAPAPPDISPELPVAEVPLPEARHDAVEPLASPTSISGAEPAQPCSTEAAIGEAIRTDPSALESILHAPAATRSVANAISVWNDSWSDAAAAGETPLLAARAAVGRGLASISDACLDAPIAGPRFVAVPDGDGSMFLVFGSGRWRWRDVTTPLRGAAIGTSAEANDAASAPRQQQ